MITYKVLFKKDKVKKCSTEEKKQEIKPKIQTPEGSNNIKALENKEKSSSFNLARVEK